MLNAQGGEYQKEAVPARPHFLRSQSDSKASHESLSSGPRLTSAHPAESSSSGDLKGNRYSAYVVSHEQQRGENTTPAQAPQRPPRNPARGSTVGVSPLPLRAPIPISPSFIASPLPTRFTAKIKIVRPNTASGTREEVTPWEFHPGPEEEPSKPVGRPSGGVYSPRTRPSRPSSSHGSAINFAEALVRRRKSTGSKAPRPRTIIGGGSSAPNDPLKTASAHRNSHVLTKTPKLGPSVAPLPATGSVANISSRSSDEKHKEEDLINRKFSTADRTIIEELKRNISARAAQFILKGSSANATGWGAQGLGAGKKHHPYTKEEAPYPRNYEREVLDLDVWENLVTNQMKDSLTWHVFETFPTKVLDLGCGAGTWLLDCARVWRECHFVGLDIVPLHPDLQQVGSYDLASRITWVQANFLEGLPFPNEEFDFVRIKRIALGVPEDKWDALFEELTRVMKPGAALEVIEEDLFFPGKMPDEDEEPDLDATRSSERANSDSMDHDVDSSATSGRPSDDVWTPATSVESSVTTVSSVVPPVVDSIEEEDAETLKRVDPISHRKRRSFVSMYSPAMGLPGSIVPPQLGPSTASTSVSATATALLTPPVKPRTPKSPVSSFVPLPLPQSSPLGGHSIPAFAIGGQVMSYEPSPSTTHSFNKSLPEPPSSPKSPTIRASTVSPFVLRTIPRAPPNPRDHSLLELVWNEMLASRFINLSPLSLLTNHLNTHFKDVRTHRPVQYAFPPLPAEARASTDDHDTRLADSDPDEDARDAIISTPPGRPRSESNLSQRSSTGSQSSVSLHDGDGSQWLSLQSLLQGSSPYITLDDSRAPTARVSRRLSSLGLPSRASAAPRKLSVSSSDMPSHIPAGADKNRLPNKTVNIDIRWLNLHLRARTSEILACAETMWEWVLDYQKEMRAQRAEQAAKATQRARSRSIESPFPLRITSISDCSAASPKRAVEDLTREDFDRLLCNFHMDMLDKMGMASVLDDQLGWRTFPSAPTVERKGFELELERYQKWEDDKKNQTPPSRTSIHPSLPYPPSSATPSHRGRPNSASGPPRSSEASHLFLRSGSQPRKSDVSSSTSRGREWRLEPDGQANGTVSSPTSSVQAAPIPQPRKLSRVMRVYVAWKA